ncbi:hypothetical protein GCM10009827_052280 [Dactylosporangium maewongense]|uniref:SAP domain-containing protein n=1 Tax=Dactylosporangium maewongense TaxID=634393 RepID=A0ABP4LPB6_9ACTN
MTDLAGLLVQIQQRFVDFLAGQSEEDLTSLAEGRLALALVDHQRLRPSAVASVTPEAKPAAGGDSVRRRRTSPAKAAPAAAPKGAGSRSRGKAPIDATAVAAELRELGTLEDGIAYLSSRGMTVDQLKQVCVELNIRPRGNKGDIEKQVLNQAIGARRKYAGLREW